MQKVAVTGFGFMGMTHVINILENKELQLVAIIDKNPEGVEKMLQSGGGNFSTGMLSADRLKNVGRYTSLDECIEKEDLDSVHICVHTDLHYEMTKKALLKGKHVFVEKPFCLDVEQAEELVALAGQQKKVLMVGHVLRFMSPYQKLKQWIESKEFGELRFLSMQRFSGVPAWGQWKEAKVRKSSGGALFDLVIHDIDFCNYVLGIPDEVKCNWLPGELSDHDYINAWWTYREPNIRVRIEGGNVFHRNFPFQAGFTAQFERASVTYTTARGEVIQVADDEELREVPAGDAGSGYYNEIAYFSDCIRNNVQPVECSPLSSLQTIRLCYQNICRS